MNFFLPILLSFHLLLLLLSRADAKDFLASGNASSESDSAAETDMSDMLVMLLGHPRALELTEAVRDRHAKDSHSHNQKALQSMFKSLPKNQFGNLDMPAARYAMHRLFEYRHRWFVRGLHPKTKKGAKDAAGRPHAVGKALQLLTKTNLKGLSLSSLAALVGTLEELIQKEVASHLEEIYATLKYTAADSITGDTLKEITESYMTIYISGASFHNNTKEDVKFDDKFMTDNTRGWTETKEWIRSTTLDAMKNEETCKVDVAACKFTLEQSIRVVKFVVEKYGYFNDNECSKLKTQLANIGTSNGRVKLADFYKAGLSGAWEFNEKVDYLRSLGTLDDSSKDDPKVIIPNYVSSWVNCLSSSDYYSVCCRNECEDYMKVIEEKVAGPHAHPDQIILIVSTAPELSLDAPPNMGALRHRLVNIADRHHGKVPIHGRLFAQWMHHVFPSTCPYPHVAGTTDPQTPDEWMAGTGHTNIQASHADIMKIMDQAKASMNVVVHEKDEHSHIKEEIPWSDVEELLVVRSTRKPEAPSRTFLDSCILLLEVLFAAGVVLCLVRVAAEKRKMHLKHNKGRKC